MKPAIGLPFVAFAACASAGPELAPPESDHRTRIVDKRGYSLWNPVPRELMREMSTDRPDQTESAYTVDAGHLQIEMDLVSFTRDDSADGRVDEWNVAPINLKLGLAHNIDAQFIFGGWIREELPAPDGHRSRVDGIGDLTVRAKVNLWGNDGGSTALALMPFVKFPLGSDDIGNDEIEGGLIVPLAWKLAEKVSLGLMTEIDLVASDDGGHEFEWLNSITCGVDLTERLGAYVEFVGVIPEDGGWIGQFDAGLTFAINDDIQLDAGCNFGLTESAPDFQPFVGLSIRF